MGTITVRFTDEEEQTIREIAGEQNLPPSTFLKSIVMENLGNSREDLLQRGVGRVLPHRSRKPLALDMGMKADSSHPSCII